MKSLAQLPFSTVARPRIYPPKSSFRTFSSAIEKAGEVLPIDSKKEQEQRSRIEELKTKLKTETPRHIFEVSRAGKEFLRKAGELNVRYSRGGKSGYGWSGVEALVDAAKSQSAPSYYSANQLQKLFGSAKDIQKRMRVKGSEAYLNHATKVPQGAKNPHPILKVIMPDVGEIEDLSGEIDPSNQNRYSPLPGLLHKYGMALAMVAQDCSSHCRYCYRLDLFNGSSGKTRADMPLIAAYIKTFNLLVEEAIKNCGEWSEESGLWVHKDTKEPLIAIQEIVFSGGDPMTLPNATLARYMVLMAEAGVNNIRIGTKDLVFCPERFDKDFWKMIDLFHQNYPDVKVDIVGHYVHPFELVEPIIDENGEYVYDIRSEYKVREDIKSVLDEINKRSSWIHHYNQFPLISDINDSPEIIRLLLYITRRLGIEMHNIYACREIPGNLHFRGENSIERQFHIVKKGNIALTQIEGRGYLTMSTEYGKFRVIDVVGDEVILNLTRFVNETMPDETTIKVNLSKLPEGQEFYWLTEEVVKLAVDDRGKKVLEQISNYSNSFITSLKKLAASTVSKQSQELEQDKLKAKTCASKLEIEVAGKVITLDFGQELENHAQKPQDFDFQPPSTSPKATTRSRVLDLAIQRNV